MQSNVGRLGLSVRSERPVLICNEGVFLLIGRASDMGPIAVVCLFATCGMEFEVALCFRLAAACWRLTLSPNRHTCNGH